MYIYIYIYIYVIYICTFTPKCESAIEEDISQKKFT